jgi:hypothetical protein
LAADGCKSFGDKQQAAYLCHRFLNLRPPLLFGRFVSQNLYGKTAEKISVNAEVFLSLPSAFWEAF